MHTSLCTCEDTLSSSSSTDSIGIEKKSSSSAYVCRLGFLVESLPCAPLSDASSKTEKIKILEDTIVVTIVCCCLFAIYVMISKSKVACKEEKALNAVHIMNLER